MRPRSEIELTSAIVNEKICAWKSISKKVHAYSYAANGRYPFPVVNFAGVNHSSGLIVFTGINVKAKHLPQGLSGLPVSATLAVTHRFHIEIPGSDEGHYVELPDQIGICPGAPFRFEVGLYESHRGYIFVPDGRLILDFSLCFSGGKALVVPSIYLNCDSESEKKKVLLRTLE